MAKKKIPKTLFGMLLFILMTGSRKWAQQTKTAAAASQLDITNLNVVSNAVWLFSLSPSCRQFCWTAKDGRFMKTQTLPILRSHKTLTYLLCRLTGRQAVSKYTVPETSSYYFWNTHSPVSYTSSVQMTFTDTEFTGTRLDYTSNGEKRIVRQISIVSLLIESKCRRGELQL